MVACFVYPEDEDPDERREDHPKCRIRMCRDPVSERAAGFPRHTRRVTRTGDELRETVALRQSPDIDWPRVGGRLRETRWGVSL